MIITDHRGGRKTLSFDITTDQCGGWTIYPYNLHGKRSVARRVIKEAKRVRQNSPEYKADPYRFVMFDTAGDYCGPMPEKPVLFRASPFKNAKNQFPFPYMVDVERKPEKLKKYFMSFIGAYTSNKRAKHCKTFKRLLGTDMVLVVRDGYHTGCKRQKEEFMRVMRRSRFTLCPRGYGPSAKRMYFAMATGSIPVIPKGTPLPFPSVISWDKCVIQYTSFEDCVKQIRGMTEKETGRMSWHGQEEYRWFLSRRKVMQSVGMELHSLRKAGKIK